MKIKHQLSIATLIMAGVFATGCSQQMAGGSQAQAEGGSQMSGGSQVSGGSQQQVEGGSQVGGSQQQVEAAAPVVVEPAPEYVAPAPAPAPVDRWAHNHPEAPDCAKTRSHSHKYSDANHRHNYSCQGMAAPQQPQVDVYALQRKLKAKGYYKGPIDGVVGPGTRDALQRFMKR